MRRNQKNWAGQPSLPLFGLCSHVCVFGIVHQVCMDGAAAKLLISCCRASNEAVQLYQLSPWAKDRGHWASSDFKDYAEICFKTYGDRVKKWITVNELLMVAQLGYDYGVAPPGRCSLQLVHAQLVIHPLSLMLWATTLYLLTLLLPGSTRKSSKPNKVEKLV